MIWLRDVEFVLVCVITNVYLGKLSCCLNLVSDLNASYLFYVICVITVDTVDTVN